jgi:hypothetical protein
MRFSRMWDIGGCRCILKNDSQVYKLKAAIETQLEVKKVYDYIKDPQKDGYKSLHLFVNLPGSKEIIEVQIRNQIDHNWATLVEITDLLFDAKLKEYGDNKELLRFHFLLSKVKELSAKEKRAFANILKKYSYFDKLSEVFTRNYIQVREQWLRIETQTNHKYYLIVATKVEVPKIESFSSFTEAELRYFDVYKSVQNANVVLTHLPTPNYNQINIAYSNYILSFHTFLDDCLRILESLIVESLRSRRVFPFIKFFSLYNGIVANHIINLVDEVKALTPFANEISKKSKKSRASRTQNLRKEKDWLKDINKQINQNKERTNKLRVALRNNMPLLILERRLIGLTIKVITNKYSRRIEKAMKPESNS